ncbi:glycosyl hydrolase family 26 [candidate division KSB1 bacterium]|nr:glycosyl hydrolase family 26 [candidate division KSB1 bacterium]
MRINLFLQSLIASFLIIVCTSLFAGDSSLKPVSPNASPEAVKLYEYIQSISGEKILAGQHHNPLRGTSRLSVVHRRTQKYPAVVGHDFGFSYPGYWDGINYRQQIIDDAIRRDDEGFINTIMWHAVVPTLDEPATFRPGVQTERSENHPTEEQWKELTTPGTHLNERWKSQVDVVAWFLKQLQWADVPVLWRPYHEMNGKWFWWGGRPGPDGYQKLWRMLYDRFVNFHGLNNLIWVFNCNEVKENVGEYKLFYPGDDVVDILATDVYSEGYNQMNYDLLNELAGDKPIAVGECGSPPSDSLLVAQPRWAWFMRWGDPGRGDRDIYQSEHVITLYDLPWAHIKDPKIHYPILR